MAWFVLCDGCYQHRPAEEVADPLADVVLCDTCLCRMDAEIRAELDAEWDRIREMEQWQREANEREPLPVGDGQPW